MNNFQRKGSESNTQVGKDFEKIIQKYFNDNGKILKNNYKIEIGLHSKKMHAFDLGNEKVLVECKSHKWTETQGVPSAKLKNWNEAMYLFYLAPSLFKKYFVVENCFNQKRIQSLLEYYIENYYNLIPRDVILLDYYIESKTCDRYEYNELERKHTRRNDHC